MKKIYHINCDCASYNWERYPPKGYFMKCKMCGKKLGIMEVSVVSEKNKFFDILSLKNNI